MVSIFGYFYTFFLFLFFKQIQQKMIAILRVDICPVPEAAEFVLERSFHNRERTDVKKNEKTHSYLLQHNNKKLKDCIWQGVKKCHFHSESMKLLKCMYNLDIAQRKIEENVNQNKVQQPVKKEGTAVKEWKYWNEHYNDHHRTVISSFTTTVAILIHGSMSSNKVLDIAYSLGDNDQMTKAKPFNLIFHYNHCN
ncbi:hypothetical protein RFI_29303 [Reticulomyxa filosa]|uniref:Uncharacterized protein n=1 Tax=Reticulomyxa filosa TaxID=46433 RepID=X6M2H7_RETFI|nr:hypothetical protein RFI_29303 [Reticulomyxa filosa]|eukprot:ETO08089.1 hypothetical protein RFI_29303 [Reticulomyxa filosa]